MSYQTFKVPAEFLKDSERDTKLACLGLAVQASEWESKPSIELAREYYNFVMNYRPEQKSSKDQ